METEQDGPVLYTVGHSNIPADEFVALLRSHRIELVVDVRSAPYSQYTPQFNRENLVRTLEVNGIGYRFAGDRLGGRPTDPTCYKDGESPVGKTDYLRAVDYAEVARRSWYQDGITDLVALAADARVAIMCSEEDPQRCHRHHLIAPTLRERGLAVWHIRRNGALERAEPVSSPQLTLF
jgi:uncharacterized protein (DUF488 family)